MPMVLQLNIDFIGIEKCVLWRAFNAVVGSAVDGHCFWLNVFNYFDTYCDAKRPHVP